jgi:hypothetical protein
MITKKGVIQGRIMRESKIDRNLRFLAFFFSHAGTIEVIRVQAAKAFSMTKTWRFVS